MKKVLISGVLALQFFTAVLAQESKIYSLEECIDVAIENNLLIKRSRLNLASQEVNLKQTRASQLPNANLGWNFGYNWGRSIDPTTNQFIQQRINSSGFNGNSSVTLFNGLQQYYSVNQGRLNIEGAEADLEDAKNDISLTIATSYLNVLLNKELLANARFQLESSQTQLDRMKILVESGAMPITNQLQLESQLASNEVSVINAQNGVDLAFLSLKQGMLLPASEDIDIEAPNINVEGEEQLAGSTQEIYDIAADAQPDIKSADLGVDAAVLGIKIAQGGMSPVVSLGGGFSTNYSDAFSERFVSDGTTSTQVVPTSLSTASGEAVFLSEEAPNGSVENFGYGDQFDENLSWNLGIGISIPIFNGLQTRSNIQRSQIALAQAEINAVEQRNILRQNIESAYADALAASKTYEASVRQVSALEETFRSLENQYNLGAANFTDYQVASNNLFQARSDLLRSKYDFVFKKKILEFYQGKSLLLE